MERGIALIDFVNIDSMVQVHGNASALAAFPCYVTHHVNRPRGRGLWKS